MDVEPNLGDDDAAGSDGFAISSPFIQGSSLGDAELEFLEMEAHVEAADLTPARTIAVRLRRRFSEDPTALSRIGGAWVTASPADALRDASRALEIDPEHHPAWMLLGIARNNLGDRAAAVTAFREGCRRNPNDLYYDALKASVEARTDQDWQSAFRLLATLQAQHPDDDYVRDLMARVYLSHATRDWTDVEADGDSGVLVSGIKKAARLVLGADIPPGLYATRAEHVKTASLCLTRVRRLGSSEPEILVGIEKLARAVEPAAQRRYTATWGETGGSIICGLAGVFNLMSSPFLAILLTASAVAMGMGGFEPQYRSNRIALSRRGLTLGDTVLGLAQRHKYGGVAYLFLLIGFFPFVAAYKLYVNWGDGWSATPEIEGLIASADAAAPPEAPAPPPIEPIAESVEPPSRWPEAGTATEEALPASSALAVAYAAPQPPPALAPLEAERHQGPEPVTLFADRKSDNQRSKKDWLVRVVPRDPRAWIAVSLVAIFVAAAVGIAVSRQLAPRRAVTPATMRASVSSPDPQTARLASPAEPERPRMTLVGKPHVIDTATMTLSNRTIQLSGMVGESGVATRQMASFIAEQGGAVTCDQLQNGLFQCRTQGGYDIAAAALINGAGRATPDAPEAYRTLEATARTQKRGIWQ